MTTPTPQVPADRVSPPPSPPSAPRYDPRHRGLRVVGATVAGLLTLGLAVGTVPEMVRDSQTQSFTLPEGTRELRIVGDAGDVDLRGVAAGVPTGISAEKHWSFREPHARAETSDGVTTLTMDCPGFPALGQCYADWDVAVPEDLTVVVRTSVGDVDAAGLTGDVVVRSSVGGVKVAGAPSSLDVTTSVGDVEAVLTSPAERLVARSAVGDVRVTLPGDVAYDLRTTGMDPADVRVETSSTSDYEVVLNSGVGSIVVTAG
ncbi:MAG: hypothetical protein DCC50_07585 [Acidobacteria bacterium]|nr:MAG: hypothetical protein DCC50_07585 [Acidobacteriota bacterium]